MWFQGRVGRLLNSPHSGLNLSIQQLQPPLVLKSLLKHLIYCLTSLGLGHLPPGGLITSGSDSDAAGIRGEELMENNQIIWVLIPALQLLTACPWKRSFISLWASEWIVIVPSPWGYWEVLGDHALIGHLVQCQAHSKSSEIALRKLKRMSSKCPQG